MPTSKSHLALILALLFSLGLAACGTSASEATPTLPAPVVEAPTDTPTSEPGLAILLTPEGADAELLAEASAVMQSYAAERGLRFETHPALDVAAIPSNLVSLAALAPTDNLAELAAAAPQAAFVALGFNPEVELANLQVLSFSAANSEAAAFLAGYIAAISTDDWRVGVLYAPAEIVLATGFIAGAEYFCGSCTPLAPPYEEYPAAAAADPASWRTAVDVLLSLGVRTVYLSPALELPEVVQYIASWGALVIGQAAPPAGLEANWLASVGVGQAFDLGQALPAALSRQPVEAAPFGLSQVNGAYLSEARITYIQTVIAELDNGAIRLPSEP